MGTLTELTHLLQVSPNSTTSRVLRALIISAMIIAAILVSGI